MRLRYPLAKEQMHWDQSYSWVCSMRMQSSNYVWVLIIYGPKLLDRHIFETRLSNMHVWMRVAKLGPCVPLRDLGLISDNSFPICIGLKCGVVKPWFKVLKQIVSHQHLINTQHDTDRCYSRVKVALSSTFEQISDSLKPYWAQW